MIEAKEIVWEEDDHYGLCGYIGKRRLFSINWTTQSKNNHDDKKNYTMSFYLLPKRRITGPNVGVLKEYATKVLNDFLQELAK